MKKKSILLSVINNENLKTLEYHTFSIICGVGEKKFKKEESIEKLKVLV